MQNCVTVEKIQPTPWGTDPKEDCCIRLYNRYASNKNQILKKIAGNTNQAALSRQI